MISSLDPSAESFLSGLERLHQRAGQAQRRLSSGKKLETPSDGPDRISHLLSARADLEQSQQIRLNLGRYKAENDTAEKSLARAVQLVERAIVLATQNANTTTPAASRTASSDEVTAILEQLVGITQIRVEDRYIFAGDNDQQVPYTYDGTQVYPVTGAGGAAVTRKAQHPAGTQFTVSRNAAQIFDGAGPGESVFHSVDDLRTSLSGNSQAGIEVALQDLHTAHIYLNRQLAFYGSVQNRLQDATEFASQKEVLLKSQMSEIEDADPAAEVLELRQASTQLESSLASRAQLPRRTLFDYMG